MPNKNQLIVLNRPEEVETTKINAGDAVFFRDWFSSDALEKISSNKPLIAICDVECRDMEFEIPCVFYPNVGFGIATLKDFFLDSVLSIADTQRCFYFSVNKPTLERFFLLKLIEWFNLDNFYHSFSGDLQSFDMHDVINNAAKFNPIDQDLKSFVLQSVTQIPVEWFGDGRDKAKMCRQNLSTKIQSSAVSLLCESSSFNEPNFVFTEKTLTAFLGGNFPIWVGNAGQAHAAKKMGFDIFEDIINHEYQNYDTPWDRCYFAIHDNLPLLRDLEFAKQVRLKCQDRLYHNHHHALHGLGQYVRQQQQKIPTWILDSLESLRSRRVIF